jgi:uncharacterized protein (DUF433 family)
MARDPIVDKGPRSGGGRARVMAGSRMTVSAVAARVAI